MNFGAHAHHDNYQDFESELLEEKGDFQEISMIISGTFEFHDHLNHAINGYITVNRPQNLTGWQVVKY